MVEISNRKYCIKAVCAKTGFAITSLKDLSYDKEWIYAEKEILNDKNPKESFDSQYFGGMEFIFPSDEPEIYCGKVQKDHGMLWRFPYSVRMEQHRLIAGGYSKQDRVGAVYSVELQKDSILLQINIYNKGNEEIPFLARLHPAFLLTDKSELELYPESVVYEEDGAYCSFERKSNEGMQIELERPETWGKNDLFVHLKQQRGKFAVRQENRCLKMVYDNQKLPYLTLCSFLRDGKRIGILEPANVAGVNLNRASGRDTIPILHSGECVEYSFRIITF